MLLGAGQEKQGSDEAHRMNLEIIDRIEDFTGIRDQYVGITSDAANVAPFYTHRWLSAWWKAFGGKYKIRVLCLYETGHLLGAIPLMFWRGRFSGISVRKVSFLGGSFGLHDLPVANGLAGWEDSMLSWLLSEDAPAWELLEIGPLVPFSKKGEVLLEGAKRSKLDHRVDYKPNLYLPLEDSWEDFVAKRSRNFRRTVVRKEKRVSEEEGFRTRRIRNPSTEDLRSTVFDVSMKTWQGQQGLAVASSEEGQHFYEVLSSSEGEFDSDLSALYRGDACISYLLGFVQASVYHAFDTGFDPAHAEYSPGLLVHFHAIRNVVRENVSEFNFGHDHSYKQRFEPLARNSFQITVLRKSSLANLARIADAMKRLRL